MKTYAVGIDLGGTAIKYGISNHEGEIVQEFTRPTQATAPAQTILDDLADAARHGLEYAGQHDIPIKAIGLGTPGAVQVDTGFLKGSTPNLPAWKNVPIRDELMKRLALPVFVDNDANMMAYGEYRLGAGQNVPNVVCVTLGTGIGGGIVVEGKLFRGANDAGSEIGHMSICYNGRPCPCGGIGCWERYASATAMIERYNLLNPEQPVQSTITIFERYHQGEEAAATVVEEEIQYAAVGVANVINIFNPQRIIIGGGVSETGDWFVERIAQAAKGRSMVAAAEGVQIVRASLGNKAGWLGAAMFALDQLREQIGEV